MPLHFQTDDRDCITERPIASLVWMPRTHTAAAVCEQRSHIHRWLHLMQIFTIKTYLYTDLILPDVIRFVFEELISNATLSFAFCTRFTKSCWSLSEHIRQVVSDCSQTLYALRVLRHHGLTDVGLHSVFRSVVVAKLLYACSAWSGFITASGSHRVDEFLRRSKRSGYCQPDLPSFDELLEHFDDRLFNKLCNNTGHLLHYLIPPPNLASQHYSLRLTSSHNRQIPTRTGHLTDANFKTRLLYKDCYWFLF